MLTYNQFVQEKDLQAVAQKLVNKIDSLIEETGLDPHFILSKATQNLFKVNEATNSYTGPYGSTSKWQAYKGIAKSFIPKWGGRDFASIQKNLIYAHDETVNAFKLYADALESYVAQEFGDQPERDDIMRFIKYLDHTYQYLDHLKFEISSKQQGTLPELSNLSSELLKQLTKEQGKNLTFYQKLQQIITASSLRNKFLPWTTIIDELPPSYRGYLLNTDDYHYQDFVEFLRSNFSNDPNVDIFINAINQGHTPQFQSGGSIK